MVMSAVEIGALADRLAARGASLIFKDAPETARDMTTASRTLRRLMKLITSVHVLSDTATVELIDQASSRRHLTCPGLLAGALSFMARPPRSRNTIAVMGEHAPEHQLAVARPRLYLRGNRWPPGQSAHEGNVLLA
jgi:hypothetical protein